MHPGLTSQRYDLLLMIKTAQGSSGIRVTELCDLLHLQQTAVTELVKRAEDAKLVVRRQSEEDGRVSLLGLTADGERRLARVCKNLGADRQALAASLRDLEIGRARR